MVQNERLWYEIEQKIIFLQKQRYGIVNKVKSCEDFGLHQRDHSVHITW